MRLFPYSSKKRLFIFSLLFAIWSVISLPVVLFAQTPQLSLADLLIGLRSKKASIAERNKILAEAVKQRGITFALTSEIEKELQQTGAELDLLEAVRQKSPIAKAIPAPVVKAEPTPVMTQAATVPALDSGYYFKRANSFLTNGEFDLAVVDYNKALELNQNDTWSYVNRGMAFYNKKNYELAILDFSKAIEISPKEAKIYFKRADAFEKKGKTEEALADYKKALELDAEFADAKKSIERIKKEQAKELAPPVQTQQIAEKPVEKPVEKPIEPVKTDQIINLGSLNNLAIKLAMPTYPAFDRQRKNEGIVTVIIMLDETGKVLSAEATDGPKSLQGFAEEAAKKSKFNAPKVNDQPVKAKGYIAYNFKAS